jgi:transposase
MARHRSHSIEFKRQVAQEFIAGETLHALARRHDVSRNLIRVKQVLQSTLLPGASVAVDTLPRSFQWRS